MLILTRERDESIILSPSEGTVEITIVHVTPTGKVTLGITAPKKIPVHRKEIQFLINKGKENGTNKEV